MNRILNYANFVRTNGELLGLFDKLVELLTKNYLEAANSGAYQITSDPELLKKASRWSQNVEFFFKETGPDGNLTSITRIVCIEVSGYRVDETVGIVAISCGTGRDDSNKKIFPLISMAQWTWMETRELKNVSLSRVTFERSYKDIHKPDLTPAMIQMAEALYEAVLPDLPFFNQDFMKVQVEVTEKENAA